MLAIRPLQLGRVQLSQVTSPLIVVVTDPRGAPFSGAKVTLQGQTVPVETDGDGVARFDSARSGQVTVTVQVAGFTIKKTGSSDETLFVSVPICADGPLLTNTEIIALLLGGAALSFGLYKKSQVAQILGEMTLGAGIFNLIFRHSCR